jgi:hypothetical protein
MPEKLDANKIRCNPKIIIIIIIINAYPGFVQRLLRVQHDFLDVLHCELLVEGLERLRAHLDAVEDLALDVRPFKSANLKVRE